jgi:hypothetical protein
MITKFISIGEQPTNIEFKKTRNNTLEVEIEHLNPHCTQELHVVELSEENLFSLIGQLLRIQAEIKTCK